MQQQKITCYQCYMIPTIVTLFKLCINSASSQGKSTGTSILLKLAQNSYIQISEVQKHLSVL